MHYDIYPRLIPKTVFFNLTLHNVSWRTTMTLRSHVAILAMATALFAIPSAGQAADEAKYPNWKGQWFPVNPLLGGSTPVKFDPTKAWGRSQQAPLTPEYQKIHEESMADQAKGGLGNYPPARCILGGMPRAMAATRQEFIVTSETTFIVSDADFVELRRIYTDGRDWPRDSEASYLGYSIGHWIDEGGNGGYWPAPGSEDTELGVLMEPALGKTAAVSGAHCLTKNVTGQADCQDWDLCTESDRCRRWQDRSAWVRGARWCWRWRV
jgi:hypothetical protein